MTRAIGGRGRTALLLAVALTASGCVSGRILVRDVDRDPVRAGTTGLVAGLRGVPRAEIDQYQGSLEREIHGALERSGLFQRVLYGDFEARDVDLELRVEPAVLWFDRRVHPAYFPLALATLTLYIWVGGPAAMDFQQYDVGLGVYGPDGSHRFDVRVEEWYTHGIGIYGKEQGERTCRGPDADKILRKLVEELGARLAAGGGT